MSCGLKDPVELRVAADPGMMLVIRLATAGVVARAGLGIDAMDGLKMATEEACNCLIGQDNPPARIALRFACDGSALTICAAACDADDAGVAAQRGPGACGRADCGASRPAAPHAQAPAAGDELEIVRCILEALADEVDFDMREGRLRAIELRTALAREG